MKYWFKKKRRILTSGIVMGEFIFEQHPEANDFNRRLAEAAAAQKR